MKLANCNEHPDKNDPWLSCWAIRHDDGKLVTTEELWEMVQQKKRKPLSDTEISKYFLHPIQNLGTAIAFARAIESAHGITHD